MKCKHNLLTIKRKYKGMNIFKVTCTKCGLCSIWAETKELAKEFFNSGDKEVVRLKDKECF